MQSDLIERWAGLLVDYCLRVAPGETIVIAADWDAHALVTACYRAVVLRGAFPVVRVEPPGLAEFFVRHACEELLAQEPPFALHEADKLDGIIRIAAESDTRSMREVDPARQATADRARDAARRASRRKRWVLTQYPTAAYAAQAEMPLDRYEEFVAAAMFLDRPDPVAAWQALGKRQAGLVDYMSRVRTVHIKAPGTDLTLDVSGRTWINSDGRRNMPSGEIFTGPHESSAQGRLRCAFPVCRGGREIEGIELEFADGRVVAAKAGEGEDYLRTMLDLDPGARRLGELGLGLNQGIQQFTSSILYDEKIGGTAHLALGQSYPETGGTNTSALHWDLIVDLREGGRIHADGRLVMEDGHWLVGNENEHGPETARGQSVTSSA